MNYFLFSFSFFIFYPDPSTTPFQDINNTESSKRNHPTTKKSMSCFVPFNSRNIDISIFAFKPTVVLVDELIESLKRFSVCTENLGCVQSSIFKSIHGNLVSFFMFILRCPPPLFFLLDFHFFIGIFRSYGMEDGWRNLLKTKKFWSKHLWDGFLLQLLCFYSSFCSIDCMGQKVSLSFGSFKIFKNFRGLIRISENCEGFS